MEIKPLKAYKKPAYPEKEQVLRNPNLLKRMPERWKGNIRVGAALSSVLVLMLAGCSQRTAGTGGSSQTTGAAGSSRATGTDGTTGSKEGTATLIGGKVRLGESMLVAPIFQYGDGTGGFGCVSVAPPAFLSEAEAFEVISREAEKEGLRFKENGLKLENVDVPVTSISYDPQKDPDWKLKRETASLELDGYDEKNKIAFEFVSKDDVVNWQDRNAGVYSSVELYEALKAAESLRGGLERKTDGNLAAVFYDPMGFDEELYKKYDAQFRAISEDKKLSEEKRSDKYSKVQQKYGEEIKENAKTQLREQVKGFLQWCKAQGVI